MFCNIAVYPAYSYQPTPAMTQALQEQSMLTILSRAVELNFKNFYVTKMQQPSNCLPKAYEPQAQMVEALLNDKKQHHLPEGKEEEQINKQTTTSKTFKEQLQTEESKIGSAIEHSEPSQMDEEPQVYHKQVSKRKVSNCSKLSSSSSYFNPNNFNEEEGQIYCSYSAIVPKRGMEVQEIERKKESLLRRQVHDWSMVSSKTRGQKREIRMLHK